MASSPWTSNDIPNQRDNVAVVTGGNSGIGYEAARALAGKGARVILAVRNAEKGQAAVAAIQRAHPGAAAEEGQSECQRVPHEVPRGSEPRTFPVVIGKIGSTLLDRTDPAKPPERVRWGGKGPRSAVKTMASLLQEPSLP